MQEPPSSTAAATTATTTGGKTVTTTGTVATSTSDYQVGDDTLRSLRHSRNSRRGVLPQRSASGGSNSGGEPAPAITTATPAIPSPHNCTQRASNRSSAGSLWSSLMKNGRRIYGSTASIASSITCTEFNEDFSQDLNMSDHSLDLRHLDLAGNSDSRPQIPQRQTSVTAEQSSGLMSVSEHTMLSNLVKIEEQQQDDEQEDAPPPPSPRSGPLSQSTNTTSSDLSPKQPGRKTSITLSEHTRLSNLVKIEEQQQDDPPPLPPSSSSGPLHQSASATASSNLSPKQYLGRKTASGTHYEILEVPTTAPFETIKASYQQKARQLHPDKSAAREKNGDSERDAEEAFLRLQKSWECLRDAASRKDYDESLAIQNRQKTKSQALTMDDLELVQDEDTGDLCYVYTCRCGEDLWLPEKRFDTTADNMQAAPSTIYITCDGCSLVFHMARTNLRAT